jgi:biotin carboxylase
LGVDTNSDGVVLQIGSGQQLYRRYLMQGASRRLPLWLIDTRPLSWQHPYVVGASVVAMVDPARSTPDQQGLIDAALAVARSRPVLGVFTYDEAMVVATAHVAEALGVPGLGVAGANACRDKHTTRRVLTAARLPQPRFAYATTAAEAVRAADDIGYPVVIKPRGLGASMGVVRAAGEADVPAAFAVADRAGHGGPASFEEGVLVEELVDGPEISVDGVVVNGAYRPFCLARKQIGLEPYFEEVGHVVDPADPLSTDPELARVLRAAHRALGVGSGMTHTEVKLTGRGPVIIEVNARLGGDLIPYLGLLATGIDPGRVAVEVAAGLEPTLEPSPSGCAGIRFLYPPADCRVRGVTLPGSRSVAEVVEARALVTAGASLYLPPRAHIDRYAYVICLASDPVRCAAALDEAAGVAGIEYEPVDHTELVGRVA